MRQTFLKLVTSAAFSAGTVIRSKGKDLPLFVGDRMVYHRGWLIDEDLTLTYTTTPTVVGHNASIAVAQWNTGSQDRYKLTGNALRQFERHEAGKCAENQTLTAASTNVRHVRRYIPNGPRSFMNQDDFDIPVSLLQDAEFSTKCGALTDMSADCTVATGTVRHYAVLTVSDDIHIPAFFERREETVATGQTLEGECLLAEIALANSTSYDAIAAASFTSLTVETGMWNVVDGADAQLLTENFNQLWTPGQLDALQGEPREATFDVNQRKVSLTSPTAVAAQDADLQTVLHYGPRQKTTGLIGYVRNNFKVKWTGSNGNTTVRLVGRFLPMENDRVASMVETVARITGRVPVPSSSKVKTLTDGHAGPFGRFMRRTTKVMRKAA